MRSPRGFTGAAVFLLALPVTVLYEAAFGGGVEVVIHAALALGSALTAFAVFDFKTSRWIAWVGCAAAGTLAAIFLLQGVGELVRRPGLTRFVYQVLGQRLEGRLVDLFLLWCIGLLLLDSAGKSRILGLVVMSIVVCVEVYSIGLSAAGRSLDLETPGFKLLFLLPFVWLLLESRKAPRAGAHEARVHLRRS